MDNTIPHKNLQNHFHERVDLPKESREAFLQRWENQIFFLKIADVFLNKILKLSGLFKHNYKYKPKWAVYHVIMRIFKLIFRIHNRLEIVGEENIPENGAIFIANHQGAQDPILFLSAFGKPVGVFTDVGNGFIADALEYLFGFVTRRGINYVMVEKMVRTILQKNRFFVIWPEGHPCTSDGSQVGHG